MSESPGKKRVLVVAAVIRGDQGRILLARRPQSAHQGGLWEFPGGKVEAGEAEAVALVRELDEELGITPVASHPLIRIRHDYPDKLVELSVWQVDSFLGHDQVAGDTGREGQSIAWFSPDDLLTLDFPAANVPIVAAARLPACWRITPALADIAAVRAWGEARSGDRPATGFADAGWLLRLPGWADDDYLMAAGELLILAGRAGVPLLLHGSVERLQALPAAAGVHLPAGEAARLLAASAGLRPLATGHFLSVAAHDAAELAVAEALGADCAFLSPVLPTASHPGRPALGWEAWAAQVLAARVPVYALGGMSPDLLDAARHQGGQGVAGISGF